MSRFLKNKKPAVRTVIADPYGSGMYCYLRTGKIETEGSSVTEGIGVMRVTENFKAARIDEALRISDQSMIDTIYHLAQPMDWWWGLPQGSMSALPISWRSYMKE